MEITKEQAIDQFGFNPEIVGIRHRNYWIIAKTDYMDDCIGADIGDLCIKTRDGGSNEVDCLAGNHGNFIGTTCDSFDCTFRYYYYRKLNKQINGRSK